MRWGRSLQTRLLVGSALSVSLVLMVAGVALYLRVQTRLYADFDAGMVSKARSTASMFEWDAAEGVELELNRLVGPGFGASSGDQYFMVRRADGPVLARSPSLGDGELPSVTGRPGAASVQALTLPDGRAGRMVSLTMTPTQEGGSQSGITRPAPPTLTLALARGTGRIEATLDNLKRLLVLIWLVTALVLAGVLAWVVRAGLAPARVLADRMTRIDETDLESIITLPNAPRELEPIVHRLNEMLGRLHRAFVREKTMVADVAHELRTPLAGLRSTLDVALARPRDAATYRDDLGQCLQISQQMAALVENLLTMTRIEAGQTKATRQPVSLAEMMRSCWSPLKAKAAERGLTVVQELDETATACTDSFQLNIVIRNVLENAVAYANVGGHVRLEVQPMSEDVTIRVTNTGCQLDASEADRVFDRFWRADAARTQAEGHCGLGLPLCRQIMRLLGGAIRADCEAGGLFEVTLTLPRAERAG